ncbi:MAG: SDR family oxidoreductase [Gammaproteobacteria bacterium]
MHEIAGRVAVITGGANGIGRGTALAMAREGVRLVLADMDAAALDEAVGAVAAIGGQARAFRCDVRDDAAFPALREATLAAFGRVDIVMNNVGVIASGLPQDIPAAEWQRILDINFLSIVRANNTFLPDLLARGEGHIVNTASFAALFPYAYDRLPYMASKAAVIALSEGLSLYLRPRGIGVTCLLPGPVRTQIGRTVKRWGTAELPLRGPGPQFRMLEPDEVGVMVVDAIRRNVFFLPTDPQIRAIIAARAADPEGFLAAQIAAVNSPEGA